MSAHDKICEKCGSSFRGNTDAQPCPLCSGKMAGWQSIVTMGDLAEAMKAISTTEEAAELRKIIIEEKGWHPDHFPFVIERAGEDSFVPKIRTALLGAS